MGMRTKSIVAVVVLFLALLIEGLSQATSMIGKEVAVLVHLKQVLSGFDFRVTDPSTGTGSGHSNSYGDVSEEFLCSTGSGDLRSPYTIKGSLGAVGPTTVAACMKNSDLYVANRRLYIVGEGVKTVTDACTSCCNDVTHLDNYSTSTQCSGLRSLPNALTVILY